MMECAHLALLRMAAVARAQPAGGRGARLGMAIMHMEDRTMTDVLEVSEDGTLTLPADVLDGARPHTRYRIAPCADGLLIVPVPAEAEGSDAWLQEWDRITDVVTAAWTGEASATGALAEIRR